MFYENATLAADADLDMTQGGSSCGLLVICLASAGTGAALVTFDDGAVVIAEVSDPGAFVTVGADPGAGSNQLWVTLTGSGTVRIRNRFGVSKNVRVAVLDASGSPR